MRNYNFALSVPQPKPKKKITEKETVKKQNIRSNREKLAREVAIQMDLKDLMRMMRDQLEIFYEDLSTKEFNEEWNKVF